MTWMTKKNSMILKLQKNLIPKKRYDTQMQYKIFSINNQITMINIKEIATPMLAVTDAAISI